MNRAIANILKNELEGLPIIAVYAGLADVREYEESSYGEDGSSPQTIIKSIPVSADITKTIDIPDNESALIPDSNKGGLLFFEDRETTQSAGIGNNYSFTSRLRLIVWVNTLSQNEENRPELPAKLMLSIIQRFKELTGTTKSIFSRLEVKIDGIPRKEKSIFSSYTFDEYNSGYLLPPYEYFALDLSVNYSVNPLCIDKI